MKILHISTYDQDGAGTAAVRLHESFLHKGYESHILLKKKRLNHVNSIEYRRNFYEKLKESFYFRFKKKALTDPDYYYFTQHENYNFVSVKRIIKQICFNPDVVIIYWTSHFLNSKNIFEIKKITGAKIYTYLMDMAPLTGGCHYAWDCKGYFTNCKECPALNKKNNLNSFNNLKRKKKYLTNIGITIIAGTTQLVEQTKNSSLFKNQNVVHIPFSIDENIFKPVPKLSIRKNFDISYSDKVIFAGAANLNEKRKGFQYFIDAILELKNILSDKVNQDEIVILIAGNKLDYEILKNIPFKFQAIGRLNNDKSLASAYQAADIYVSPSIEDSGPMMVYESLMCGTPAVTFNIGIARDTIVNGETGYIAKNKDYRDMAFGLKSILELSEEDYTQMAINCRYRSLEKSATKVHITSLIELFKNDKSSK